MEIPFNFFWEQRWPICGESISLNRTCSKDIFLNGLAAKVKTMSQLPSNFNLKTFPTSISSIINPTSTVKVGPFSIRIKRKVMILDFRLTMEWEYHQTTGDSTFCFHCSSTRGKEKWEFLALSNLVFECSHSHVILLLFR